MTIIGYARVSTTDRDLSIQEAALRAAGVRSSAEEKRTPNVLEFLHLGDLLVSPGSIGWRAV
jgi:DNA invertase Pin-like site-specific DNA recombinase